MIYEVHASNELFFSTPNMHHLATILQLSQEAIERIDFETNSVRYSNQCELTLTRGRFAGFKLTVRKP